MFRMTVEAQFSAAHLIRDYPGPCCRLHGHNYRVEVRLAGRELDALGMLIDYTEVKRALQTALAPFDHAYLNELPEFGQVNPTSEEIARVLYRHIGKALFTTEELRRRVRLVEVIVYENDRQGVGYGEETDAVI
jgi:6-pyruvoyltetrahydropterin/6-carboxytetrahydropterin synthase